MGHADSRLITLTGPGGTGKTRLALAVAERIASEFRDGVVFVPLAPLGDPAFVASAIAQRLGVREGAGPPLFDHLTAYLSDKRLLLVLDNVEHLLPAVMLVADLLTAGPGIKVLTTSRTPLHLSGELTYPVPSLALPEPGHIPPLDELAQTEAVRLFVDRAQAAKPGFTLSEDNARAVVEIVRRLDGLPLALELAAARMTILSPAALLRRLDRRLPLLSGGALDLPARQRTLRDTIAWSYDLLRPPEQALFRRLAVFAGGWTLEAAAVGGATGDSEIDVLEGLTSLADQSLVHEVDQPDGEPRFGMLETVREFALERLAAEGEEFWVRQRHAEHFAAFAESAEPLLLGAEELTWLDRCEVEIANLREATNWSAANKPAPGLRIAASLWWFWRARGGLSVGRAEVDRALRQIEGVSVTLVAKAWRTLGFIAMFQLDEAVAQMALEKSQRLFDGARDDAEAQRDGLASGHRRTASGTPRGERAHTARGSSRVSPARSVHVGGDLCLESGPCRQTSQLCCCRGGNLLSRSPTSVRGVRLAGRCGRCALQPW